MKTPQQIFREKLGQIMYVRALGKIETDKIVEALKETITEVITQKLKIYPEHPILKELLKDLEEKGCKSCCKKQRVDPEEDPDCLDCKKHNFSEWQLEFEE